MLITLDLHCARSLNCVPRGIQGAESKNHEKSPPKICRLLSIKQ